MKNAAAKGTTLACLLILTLAAEAASVSGQGTWETTLHARDINNDGMIDAWYDEVLDVTWLANANAGAGSNDASDGRMTWASANAWAAGLDVFGVTGWRLPTVFDTDNAGCDFAYNGTDCGYNVQTGSAATTVYSEMASMFYDTLGNKARFDTSGILQTGSGLSNTGPFANLQSTGYWSRTEYLPNTSSYAWLFRASNGIQHDTFKGGHLYAWAVRYGDVSPVPLPAAAWLFASAFGLFGWIARNRKAQQ